MGSPKYLNVSGDAPAVFVVGGGGGGSTVVTQAGSTGRDYSANKPTLPNVGANFGATGPYANYVLVATLAANATRNAWVLQNQSAAQIVAILDDGTATAGNPPTNATPLAYAAASVAGGQGGADGDPYFKGRIQVYAPSAGAQVALAER